MASPKPFHSRSSSHSKSNQPHNCLFPTFTPHPPLSIHSSVPLSIRRRNCSETRAFLGVGMSELMLVGAASLVLFGPEGVTQALRGGVAVLRSLRPALKDLNNLSREIRDVVEKELGLDDLKSTDRISPSSSTLIKEKLGSKKIVTGANSSNPQRDDSVSFSPSSPSSSSLSTATDLLREITLDDLESELKRRRSEGENGGGAESGSSRTSGNGSGSDGDANASIRNLSSISDASSNGISNEISNKEEERVSEDAVDKAGENDLKK
eukprot:CAMPEP_0175054824 /NCGR_PEP_ID=MMETSP0052_2-20121109/9719_1 /TAXON_ID=51329 ORGANISM="Polytomella parva, Strain SAG 63-3" /NCGR_SAMPLE_ID=MMETSP0052_2 /ASSEMBLY_ACC=CAM_ASM_000194 /LENGTH=265 /DNA_ID=CAMNT_0016319561 /DNA_START=229 /DNA_END=1026 /DNA_ORIENTATION=+